MRTRKLAWTEGIAAGGLFGTAAVFIRFLHTMDVFYIAFWRVVIACLTLGMILVALGKPFNFISVRKNLKSLLILSFFLTLHFIFFISAVKDTTILNATVLVNTTPIFSIFVSSVLFHVKPSSLGTLGLAFSLVGVCVIAYTETAIATNVNACGEGFSPSLKGDLEAVLAALVEALYLNFGRKIRKRMDILATMFPIYLMAGVTLGFLGTLVTRGVSMFPTEVEFIIPLAALGILPTATAHTLYFSSLSNLESFETAAMALLEPVGATVLGIILWQEIPGALFVLGAILVLTGIVFVIKGKG